MQQDKLSGMLGLSHSVLHHWPAARTLTTAAASVSSSVHMLSSTKDMRRSSNIVVYCIIMPGEAVAGGAGPSCCRMSPLCRKGTFSPLKYNSMLCNKCEAQRCRSASTRFANSRMVDMAMCTQMRQYMSAHRCYQDAN